MEPHDNPPGLHKRQPVELGLEAIRQLLHEQSRCLQEASRRMLDETFEVLQEKFAAQKDVVTKLSALCQQLADRVQKLERNQNRSSLRGSRW